MSHLSISLKRSQENQPVLIGLSETSAITTWNHFVETAKNPAPVSFNPNLFFFYKAYFHWKPYYFLLYQNEELVGLLPIVNTGKKYVSLPHFSYGGVLAILLDTDFSQIVHQLVDILKRNQYHPGFYRYNGPQKYFTPISSEFPVFIRGLNPLKKNSATEKVISCIELPVNQQEIWNDLSSNLRRKIRRTEKSGVHVRKGGSALLGDFYKVYAKRMHELGSPAYGKDFFQALLHWTGPDEANLYVAYLEDRPVGGAFLLSYKGFHESAWMATDSKYNRFYLSDDLHWTMISAVIRQKGKIYSLGRSTRDSGVFFYKNHWPVKNSPLYIYKTGNKFSIKNHLWVTQIWKRIPLSMAHIIGPRLIKHMY